MEANKIKVEVVYATQATQVVLSLQVAVNSTIEEVIQHSGILSLFPEIDLSKQKVGIFSKTCALSDPVKPGDRIEIYRPLKIDPKEARRAKAKKK